MELAKTRSRSLSSPTAPQSNQINRSQYTALRRANNPWQSRGFLHYSNQQLLSFSLSTSYRNRIPNFRVFMRNKRGIVSIRLFLEYSIQMFQFFDLFSCKSDVDVVIITWVEPGRSTVCT